MIISTRLLRSVAVPLMAATIFTILPGRAFATGFREPERGRHAMVASQHEIASQIGVNVLKRGGNAVDAAIAVGIALAVVYPEAGNIGGGGFMVIRLKNGEFRAIDYREMAPAAATRNMFVDRDGNLIRGEGSSTVGYRASGVPGTLAGFEMAFKKYGSGKVRWSDLVDPAAKVARDGYRLSHRLAELFKTYRAGLSQYPESNRIFLNNGKYFNEGDILKQPELAATLDRVSRSGASDFYTGRTAELIASDMRSNNGLITMTDLANYKAIERTPLRGNYRGHEIVSMPPPSSGGIVMLQVLNMLEKHDVSALGFGSAAKYHLLAEASKRAFADRAEYMADPDFADVPTQRLTSKEYAVESSISIKNNVATPSIELGKRTTPRTEGTETTHYSVIDKDGMVVSNTYTINDLYGSQVTIKGTGILMNDEMDDFAARPGTPNLFGLIQGEQNAVQPGKRPLSSMTPTIVMRRDGSVWFALGARGGPRIISAVLQSVINVIDHGMDIQAAIDAPRIHHQWLPDEIRYEPFGVSPDTLQLLKSYGHKFPDRPGYVASATGIMVDDKGVRLGAIDSRSDGKAIGY